MRTWKSIAIFRGLVVLSFTLLGVLLSTGAALASDCPPDDPSRSDCKAAATTARNPLVPIAGGVAGTVGGLVGGQTGNGKGEKGEKPDDEGKDDGKREDPCQGLQDAFTLAKLNQQMLLQAYLTWTNTIKSLDELYWATSKAGYYSGVIDVGFLAGSVFGRPLAGLWELGGKKIMGDTLKQKLIEAAIKSIIKNSMKDVSKVLDPAELASKLSQDMGKKYLQELITREITSSIMQDYLSQGLRAGGFDGATVKFLERIKGYDQITKIVKDSYAAPVANFLGDTLSLFNAGMDALSSREKLEIIRQRINAARDMKFNAEQALENANFEVELARDAYNYCTQGETYQRYLKYLAFLKLPRQG